MHPCFNTYCFFILVILVNVIIYPQMPKTEHYPKLPSSSQRITKFYQLYLRISKIVALKLYVSESPWTSILNVGNWFLPLEIWLQ